MRVPCLRVATKPPCRSDWRCADVVVSFSPVVWASASTLRSPCDSTSSNSIRFGLAMALATRANWSNNASLRQVLLMFSVFHKTSSWQTFVNPLSLRSAIVMAIVRAWPRCTFGRGEHLRLAWVDKRDRPDLHGRDSLVATGDLPDPGRCVGVLPDIDLAHREPGPAQLPAQAYAVRAPRPPE